MTDAFIICAGYTLLSVGTYLIWPSRWNILAHINAGFVIVAYVIPLFALHYERKFTVVEVHEFAQVMLIGSVAYTVALIGGAVAAGAMPADKLFRQVARLHGLVASPQRSRLYITLLLGILLTCVAAVGMGGLPLFSADPYTAKYLRGEYAGGSSWVSITYRLGTSILTILPPLAIVLIARDRQWRTRWVLVTLASMFLMAASMQRGPLAEGALLAVMAILIARKRYLLAIGTVLAIYMVGTVFYTVLGVLGVGTLASASSPSSGFFMDVAAGVPDITDTMYFLRAWDIQGSPTTGGRTMWGGLIPGQYEWNSAVWSLTTLNFGADINSIRSGGLRMPVPVWGLTSWGRSGIVTMSVLVGAIVGYATRRAARAVARSHDVVTIVVITTVLSAVEATVGSIYAMSYLDFIMAAALLWVLLPILRAQEPAEAGEAPGITVGSRTARRAGASGPQSRARVSGPRDRSATSR